MAHPHRVARTPGAVRKLAAALGELHDRDVELREQQLAPGGEVRRQLRRRPRRHQLPQRFLEAVGRRQLLRHAERAHAHAPDGALGLIVKLAHQSIADRINAGARIPFGDQAPELRRAADASRKRGRHPAAPAAASRQRREENRAIIKLHAQHVGRRRSRCERREVIADLLRARAKIVVRADCRLIAANQRLRVGIIDRARIGAPHPPGRRIERDAGVPRGSSTRPARSSARAPDVKRNAPADRPRDVSLAIADHHVLLRDADGGRERAKPPPPRRRSPASAD